MQLEEMQMPNFEQTKQMLNLVPNVHEVLECHGQIQGKRPMYLPADTTLTRKLVQPIFHAESLTMAAIRKEHWIPTLRKLTKSKRSTC